jgi:ADP-ribose pyrophosphatase YjhB (NUDIX family)
MPTSPYVASVRARIGHDLLLLPSVTVLPVDDDGRLLLVRHSSTGVWGVVGGAVEPDEHPVLAAAREAREETGYDLEVGALVGNVGGPAYRVAYPNGDRAAYVSAVYEARVVGGEAAPDGDEAVELGWFTRAELAELPLNGLATALLHEVGWLD